MTISKLSKVYNQNILNNKILILQKPMTFTEEEFQRVMCKGFKCPECGGKSVAGIKLANGMGRFQKESNSESVETT